MNPSAPLQPGDQVGKYQVVRMLGQGGMGMVFEVRHAQLGTRAALKLLWTGQRITKELAGRFIREARAGGVIEHPGVAHVHEYDQLPDGTPYILMEYLAGETLSARLREHPRLGSASLPILRQIADTLSTVHARRIVHRDLKPGNVMLVPDSVAPGGERVKILDFGIAKILATPDENEALVAEVRTADGALMGTPGYMAPELWRDPAGVNEKTDVYALGVMAFQMLTGRLPFTAEAAMALMFQHINDVPPGVRALDVAIPDTLSTLVAEMLAKESAARPTMRQVAERLAALGEISWIPAPQDVPMPPDGAVTPGADGFSRDGDAQRGAGDAAPAVRSVMEARTLSDQGAKTAPSLMALPAPVSSALADGAPASRALSAVALPEDRTLRPQPEQPESAAVGEVPTPKLAVAGAGGDVRSSEDPTHRKEPGAAAGTASRMPVVYGVLLLALLVAAIWALWG